MELSIIGGLQLGLSSLSDPMVVVMIALGCLLGTLIGALPGLGPSSGCSLLLPIAISMPDPRQGLALLCSIYLGCMFGGRITAILINVPGDAAAVATTFDGYPLMQQGRGATALGVSACSSFFGGLCSFAALTIAAPALARLGLLFGPPEFFSVMLFGFAAVIGMADDKILRSVITLMTGILLGCIGIDTVSGAMRYVFVPQMFEGLSFAVCALGLFGMCETMRTAEENRMYTGLGDQKLTFHLRDVLPRKEERKPVIISTLRSTLLGAFIGFLPGAGGTIATFVTYSMEKSLSKHPEQFGKGCVEGVAAPEAANNASVGGALIPMFALGIPGSGTTAVILGAMIMFGLQTGPRVFEKSGHIVWASIVALYVANIFLLFINTALIPVFVKAIDVGQKYLKAIIIPTVLIGVYAITYGTFAFYIVFACCVLGYFFKKHGYPVPPMLLALVLFDTMEESFRQSIAISRGNYLVFFQRPISLLFIILAVLWMMIPVFKQIIKKVRKAKAAQKFFVMT